MVCDKRCGRRWYGRVKGKAEFCREHKRDDMVSGLMQLIFEDGCMTRATTAGNVGETELRGSCVGGDGNGWIRCARAQRPAARRRPRTALPVRPRTHCKTHASGEMTKRYTYRRLPSGRLRGRGDVRPAGRTGCVLRNAQGAGQMSADEGPEVRGVQQACEFGRAGEVARRCK